jgi:uncharacterized protein YndB with AHSA1/START domain
MGEICVLIKSIAQTVESGHQVPHLHAIRLSCLRKIMPEQLWEATTEISMNSRWIFESEASNALYRYREGTPHNGAVFTSAASYQDIVPNRCVVTASTMTIGDHRISASLVKYEMLSTETGTDLIFTHQGAFFEGSDGPQIREAGWRTLLDRLATEVDHP